MRVAIFGADGRTGVEVVKYAKSRGFDVVAFVYSDAPNSHVPIGVTLVRGNVMDYDAVLEAVRGSDAVISALGHIPGSDPRMQTKGISNIVRAMSESGVKRIVSLTGTGARAEGDTPSIIDRVLNAVVGVIDPDRIRDGIEHVQVLRDSHLDWTVVRVLKLQNGNSSTTNYVLTDGGPAELQTSREKVARVLVDVVEDPAYVGKLPVISKQ